MMYQFLPSPVGAVAGISSPAAAAACSESSDSTSAESSRSAVSSVWMVSSSAMFSRLLRKRVEQLVDEAQENLVDHRKIGREREHRDDHHQRRRAHLFPRRP